MSETKTIFSGDFVWMKPKDKRSRADLLDLELMMGGLKVLAEPILKILARVIGARSPVEKLQKVHFNSSPLKSYKIEFLLLINRSMAGTEGEYLFVKKKLKQLVNLADIVDNPYFI